MSSELLGTDWWQWQEHGDSRPTTYDIKVVVYRHIGLEDVKKKYPISPQQRKDYRYVEYAEAVRYLDGHIEENAIASLTASLQETKAKIIQQLGVQ